MSEDLSEIPSGGWPGQAGEDDVPVLRATAAELARLERDQDRIAGGQLANAILRDPLMTLRVLRFLQQHRTRSQTADITTIAHALMMLGVARFFREFRGPPVLEQRLAAHAPAVERIRQTMSEARLASLFARDWAVQRHDIDPEEVMVAALLHDAAEIAWLCADPRRASGTVPVLPPEVRHRFFAHWGLPRILAGLLEPHAQRQPRELNVTLACELARACAHGWHGEALGLALGRAQRLLHLSAPELWERVRRIALQAARDWRVYGVYPAARLLPLLPEEHGRLT